MLIPVLSGFALALAAPLLTRVAREATGWIVALLPLSLLLYFSSFIGKVSGGNARFLSYAWVPSMDVDLSFHLDGLSLLFSLIVTGIGVLIMVYSRDYFLGRRETARFYSFTLSFMSSMLGVVLVDNLVLLYVFWELTSIWSFLLIGFDHEKEAARRAALQALIVTTAGGLSLLAGALILGEAGGTYKISTLLGQGDLIRAHPLYLPILALFLIGAFTKSAQFPFHFWLPNAMEAPTPVSAYLHSATMVNAGIYLLARFHPVLGGTDIWQAVVISFGAATMLLSAALALRQSDLKRILAYSTVSVLGALVFLLGHSSKRGFEAAMAYLLIHCLYKAGLFLAAGSVDHEAGTRDINRLGGLVRFMPLTAAGAGLAGLSMAGLPPLFGFIGKELLYEAALEGPAAAYLLTAAALFTNAFLVAAAGAAGLKPFFGKGPPSPPAPREAPFGMWLGPVLLGLFGLIIGLLPNPVAATVISPAVASILQQPSTLKLDLLHGLTFQMALSGITFTLGAAAFFKINAVRRAVSSLDVGRLIGPAKLYDAALSALNAVSRFQTRLLQSGHLHLYILIVMLATVGLVGASFLGQTGSVRLQALNLSSYEWMVAAVILVATALVVSAHSRLIAVLALGVIGYAVSLIYVMFGAPDLAMTQFSIDTLTVILLVLVLYRLPRYARYSGAPERIRDGIAAVAVGCLVTALALSATSAPAGSKVSRYFAENSYLLGKGRNIVNVILVDFRALDTMGEITVLAAAAVGVYSLLKLRVEKRDD